MKKFLIVSFALLSLTAHADFFGKMDMDLICTQMQAPVYGDETVRIKADAISTFIEVNGHGYTGKPMMGGSEGVPFYAQYRDTGLSLDLIGGDIEKLTYNNRTIENATTHAVLEIDGQTMELQCKGRIGVL